jgi:predicted permease
MSVPSLAVFGVALHATLKTSLVVGAGAVLSRFGYWRDSTVSDMSAATVRVLLPCFLWSSLAADLRLEALRRAWMVPVFAAAHILVGGTLGLAALAALAACRRRARRRRGFLLASAPPSRHPFWEGVLAACAFSNASGLPLSLLPTVLQGAPHLWVGSAAAGGSDAERLAKTQALAVVLVTLYAVLNKCIMWTAGRALLEGAHRRHGARRQRAGGATAAAALEVAGRPQPATNGLARMLTEPVVVACALGIGTAIVPPLQRLFARHGGGAGGDGGGGGGGGGGSAPAAAPPLGFVIDAAAFMGKAAFPMMMLLLGATLDAGGRHRQHQHQHRRHSRRRAPAGDAAMGKGGGDGDAVGDEEQLCDSAAIAIGIAVRLCAMPAAGLWLVRVAEQRGWLLPLGSSGGGGGGGSTDDGAALTRFVVLLGACMPSAMLLALMAQLHGAVQAAAMSKLLFLQYTLAPISLTLSIAAALHECTVPAVPGSVSSP